MNDVQILRMAALDLQANPKDLVRVAGIIQTIKNWWKARFSPAFAEEKEKVQQAYETVKAPLSDLIAKLQEMDKAFQNQDSDTVARLVGEVPATIALVTGKMQDLTEQMKSADAEVPVSYVDETGREIAGDYLRYTRKGYRKDQRVKDELTKLLPEEFKEIPIDKPINRPITDFKWFSNYSKQNITISNTVLNHIKSNIIRGLDERNIDPKLIESIVEGGFWEFIDNLRNVVLSSDAILRSVHFPGVSKKIQARPSNQMEIRITPQIPIEMSIKKLPIKKSPRAKKLQISELDRPIRLNLEIGMIRLHDMGTSVATRRGLSMLSAGPIMLTTEDTYKLQQAWQRNRGLLDAEDAEPLIIDGSKISGLVKKAILKERLPTTHGIIKIHCNKLHNKIVLAKILSSALRQEIDAECSVRMGNDIEVQVSVVGSKVAALSAIDGVSDHIAQEFSKVVRDKFSISVEPGISSYSVIDSDILNKSIKKVSHEVNNL